MAARIRARMCISLLLLAISLQGVAFGACEDTEPIALRVVLPKSSVCIGAGFISIEVEVQNRGRNAITLRPEEFSSRISFRNRGCSLDDGFRSTSLLGDPMPGGKTKKKTLTKGESLRQELKVELPSVFFIEGIYKMQMSYTGVFDVGAKGGSDVRTINSNEVIFEVESCESNLAVTPQPEELANKSAGAGKRQ